MKLTLKQVNEMEIDIEKALEQCISASSVELQQKLRSAIIARRKYRVTD